jgi:hypothetical protein
MSLIFLKVLRYFVISLGIIRVLFLYVHWIREYIKFRDYLFETNDYETLLLIGGIHKGEKTVGSMATFKAHKRINDRYKQTSDKHYYLFDKYMIRHFKIFALTVFGTFVFYVITVLFEEIFAI